MDKEQLLQELSQKINAGEISREEAMQRIGFRAEGEKEGEVGEKGLLGKLKHFSATKMFYVLGAVIVVVGVFIFAVQIWNNIGSVGRIAVTLGLGLILAGAGSVLLKQKPDEYIGAVFHTIGGILIPGGAVVTLNELAGGYSSTWPLAITFGVIFAFYLLLTLVHKNAVLTFFSITNATAFIYLFVASMAEGRYDYELFAYLSMVVGASYVLLGHAFRAVPFRSSAEGRREGWNKYLVGPLNFFGALGILGGAFSQIFKHDVWQLFYIFIVLGALFASIYLKSRAVLVLSTLFLIAYISYITGEYFADSLGWPISLIVLGFIFICLGYASIRISKIILGNRALMAVKPRVFIIHGWDGNPNEGWFPWLKKELERNGFEVFAPQLPDAENPRIEKWVQAVREAVGIADEQTYFVGHSLGCQAIARYLESLPDGAIIGGAVFVGGFFKRLTGLEDDPEVQETDRLWLETPLDFEKVKSHLPKSVAIFSDNDRFVPLENQDDFRDKLDSEIIVMGSMGHFSGKRDGVLELPVVLESLLKLSN